MAKKNTPVITHTEILCYAIIHLERELQYKREYYGNIPECEPMLNTAVAEIKPKLDALYELYRVETGTEYN